MVSCQIGYQWLWLRYSLFLALFDGFTPRPLVRAMEGSLRPEPVKTITDILVSALLQMAIFWRYGSPSRQR